LTTSALANQDYNNDVLKALDAVWAGPGDYEHPDAAIEAIQYCQDTPFMRPRFFYPNYHPGKENRIL